jgi:MFS family permease
MARPAFVRNLTLLLASSLTVMSGALIAPALPRMAAYYAEVPQAVLLTKLVLTMPTIFIAVISPLAGWLIDKLGKVRLFLLSMMLFALAGSAGYYLESLTEILISRAVLGIAVAGIMTTATTLIGDYFEGDARNRFLGIQAAFMALGGTVFITVSGLLADLDWRNPFLIYLFSVVVMGLTWWSITEPGRAPNNQNQGGNGSRHNRFWIILVYFTIFVGMIMFYFLPVQSPFLMQEIGIARSSVQGMGVVVVTVVSAIMSLSYGSFRRQANFAFLYGVSFGFLALGFVLIGNAYSFWGSMGGHVVVGLGSGLLIPNSTTCLMQMSPPETRGRVIGGMTAFVFLGQFLSPIIAQPLIGLSSLHGAFGFSGLGVLPLAVYWFWLSRK